MNRESYDPMKAGYRQPMSPGYRRVEPWVFTTAPLDQFDKDGLQHKPGLWAHFEITDQWRGDKQATNLELYQLAAARIPGAGVLMTEKEEYVGAEAAASNRRALHDRHKNPSQVLNLQYAVVIFGANETQFSEALEAVRRDSQRIRIAQDTAALLDAYHNTEFSV